MDTLEVLIKARAEVERGWGQRALVGRQGEVCAIGAINVVGGARRDVYPCDYSEPEFLPRVIKILAEALGTKDPDPQALRGAVVVFNNAFGTTQADVLALYDRAINLQVPRAGLDGPAVPVRVEPVKFPQPEPLVEPAPVETPEKPTEVPA